MLCRCPPNSKVLACDNCVNPPRHVLSKTSLSQIMLMSVLTVMLPFSLVMLKAHLPVTLILDPLWNSMSPLNVTLATHVSFLVSYDALKLHLSPFPFTMQAAVVSILSVSLLDNIRGPSEEKISRILKLQHQVIVSVRVLISLIL